MFGLVIPAIIAAITIPELIFTLGNERFGFLGMIWALTGFGGIFDFGLGRAAIFYISDKLENEDYAAVGQIYNVAKNLSLSAGLLGGFILICAALLGAQELINYSEVTKTEVFYSLILVALMIPMQSLITTLRGVNESFHQFKLISFVRVLNGVISFLGPFVVSIWTSNLIMLVLPLLLAKIISLLLSIVVANNAIKKNIFVSDIKTKPSKNLYYQMIKFGGWATVSTIISPLMVQADRFFIGTYISVAAVGIYVLPMEAISQSLLLIGGVTTVMYPYLSRANAKDVNNGISQFKKYSFIFNVLFLLFYTLLILFIPIIFRLWIGDIDESSITIAKILCLGAFFNSISGLKYSMIQGMGRADITAKIHIFELPIYIVMVVYMVPYYGLIGAAIAWSTRMVLDYILLTSTLYNLKKNLGID